MDEETGLIGGHAYSVTNVVVAQTEDGEEQVCPYHIDNLAFQVSISST